MLRHLQHRTQVLESNSFALTDVAPAMHSEYLSQLSFL